MSKFVHLVLDVPVKQSFTYAVPEELQDSVFVGVRVVVPFGKREMTGYVIGVEETFEATYAIKDIKRVIDKESLYGENSVELALWMSRFYLCSQGEALSMMVPGGRRDSSTPALVVDDDETIRDVMNLSSEQEAAIEEITRA